MNLCQLCYDEIKPVKRFPCCQTAICDECIFKYTKTKIESNLWKSSLSINCPFQACLKSLNFGYLLSLLQGTEADIIQKLLLKHYLKTKTDILTCPNASCNYCVFLPSGINLTSCSGDIVLDLNELKRKQDLKDGFKRGRREDGFCPCCNTNWRKSLDVEKDIPSKLSNLKSVLHKLLKTKCCPCCNASICFSGGCTHMVCFRCKHEFCWHCLQYYKQYRHKNKAICTHHSWFPRTLLLLLVLPLILKLILLPQITQFISLYLNPFFLPFQYILILIYTHKSLILNQSIILLGFYLLPSLVLRIRQYRITVQRKFSGERSYGHLKTNNPCIPIFVQITFVFAALFVFFTNFSLLSCFWICIVQIVKVISQKAKMQNYLFPLSNCFSFGSLKL